MRVIAFARFLLVFAMSTVPVSGAGLVDELDEVTEELKGAVSKGISGGTGNPPRLAVPSPPPTASPPPPTPTVATATGVVTASVGSRPQEASRIFASQDEYPPDMFGAYAIVAFKSGAGSFDLERYKLICEAYRLAIPDAFELDVPFENQLVTVWPVSTAQASKEVERATPSEKCDIASRKYGNILGLRAIREARLVSREISEDFARKPGPFLLAWSPAKTKGTSDALILRMDLSDVNSASVAKSRFEFWVQQIEANPELWLDGWQTVSILKRVGEAADRYGQVILDFLKG